MSSSSTSTPAADHDPTGVHELLSTLPDPGPMPADLVARITASLERERRSRLPDGVSDRATAQPLGSRDTRSGPSSRFLLAMSIAAAAAAIAGVLGVHQLNGNGAGSHLQATLSSAYRPHAGPGTVTVGLSGTDYRSEGFAGQVHELLAAPSRPARPLQGEAADVEPLAAEAGAQACLTALGLAGNDATDVARIDIASFEGVPAAVVVTTLGGRSEARVVDRKCGSASHRVLYGPFALE